MARIVTIVNWEKYQHYHDRSPPWLKLHRDILSGDTWVLGNDTSRLLQVASTLLAARYNNATPLIFDLWRKVLSLDCTESQFDHAITYLIGSNFFQIQDVEGACEQSASTALAKCSSEESRGEKSRGEKSKSIGRSATDTDFESLWSIYPKRAGTNPKAKAASAASARLAQGDTLADLIDGTRRYAAYCAATQKLRTEYVMQAARFYGPDRHFAESWDLPATKSEARLGNNLNAAAEFMAATDNA